MSRVYMYDKSTDTVYLFTDGAAFLNGYANCSASYALFVDDKCPDNIAKLVTEKPSNQHAELLAIHEALQYIVSKRRNDTKTVIVTDSDYSIKCLTSWSKQWKKNGWKTKNKADVCHKELLQKMISIYETLKNVHFHHIRSHQNSPEKGSLEYMLWLGNDTADKMAGRLLSKSIKSATITVGSAKVKDVAENTETYDI